MTVDCACQVVLDHEDFLKEMGDKFGMQDSALVQAPMVTLLSAVNSALNLQKG